MATQQELVQKLTQISIQQDKARSEVEALSAELERHQGSGNAIKDSASLTKLRRKVEFDLRSVNLTLQILGKKELEARNQLHNFEKSYSGK